MSEIDFSPHELSSTKPYLIRAMYDWIIDNNCTPFIVVNAEIEGVAVPKIYVEDGRIILNLSKSAVKELSINNESLEFNARFNGVLTHVYSPISAILAIYAQENSHGMVFNEENPLASKEKTVKKSINRPNPTDKPFLQIIKSSD